MTSTYYDRSPTYLDGHTMFATDDDREHERSVAALVERAWSVEIHHFGSFSAVDFYALRHDRMVGVVELKTRSHDHDRYPSVLLNVRKWLALQLAATGLGVPAVFVVRFADCVRWIPVDRIYVTRVEVGGCTRRVKADNDREPVIHVPVDAMDTLA